VAAEVERQDGQEQGQAAEQRVQEEGQGGTLAILVAPAGDDKVP